MSETSLNRANKDKCESIPPARRTIVTMALSLGSGLILTLLLVLPDQWYPQWASIAVEAQTQLLTYTAASMILATFILTLSQEKDPTKRICTLVTSLCVFIAAYATIQIEEPEAKLVAVVLGILPPVIAIIGMDPVLQKRERQ